MPSSSSQLWQDAKPTIEQMEEQGLVSFALFVDADVQSTQEVATKLARIDDVKTVAAILSLGTPNGHTIMCTGFLKNPVVDSASILAAQVHPIQGILRNPDGSLKTNLYVAGMIFKYRTPTAEE
jgi:hypothetical protein